MAGIDFLLENNRAWAKKMVQQDEKFFSRLAEVQTPRYLWIGCSDSRVPANEILGLQPGEIFVHRNIANLVLHTDFNCLAVLEYAIEVLKVEHVIICGHYGCGGIQSALNLPEFGLINNWLQHIVDIRLKYQNELPSIENIEDYTKLLCQFNVLQQVQNTCRTSVVQRAWKNKQDLTIHGWVYALSDGLLQKMCEPQTRPV